MPQPQRQNVRGQRRVVEICPFSSVRDGRPLLLDGHHYLHPDGRRLISSWFDRAWDMRANEDLAFESFVFAWIAVNAWAACVTGEDRDREYMDSLSHDFGLHQAFDKLRSGNPEFREVSEAFFQLLPIFKAQQLRRHGIYLDERLERRERIRQYFEAGMTDFEPECAKLHLDRGEVVPRDWPHFIQAVYRVRCNLFHGEKFAHSEMDRRIVRAALLSLTAFFREARIL